MKKILYIIKSIAISAGLMLLLPMALYYAIQIASPYPDYSPPHQSEIITEEEKTTNKAYHDQRQQLIQKYETVYFYASLIVGILFILVGAFASDFFGFGFIMGGTFSIIIGYLTYWSQLNNLIKLLTLLGAIGLLIMVGMILARKYTD